MSTQTLGLVGAPSLPRVNLLPPEIAEQARFRRMQYLMGGAVLASAVLVAGGYVLAHGGVTDAQKRVDAANSTQTQLQHQIGQYANVRQINADVQAHEAMLTAALSGEVQWSHYLNDLSLKVPDNVWLTNITAQATPGGAAQAKPGQVQTVAKIGQVTFGGVAFTHDDVATWLEALATEPGYANPYFSNSTESKIGDQKVVNFTSTVDLTPDAHSGRYTKPAGG